jgi:chemotaxis protein methyltransferase CheR
VTKLQPDEMAVLAKYIHSVSGISLDASKGYLIESRLAGLASELGCGNYSELYFKAKADAAGKVRRRIIDAITTGETLFFRDNAPFELLRHKIIPDLIDARTKAATGTGPIPIRIWSAACSSGQEIYSIGIALKETLGNNSRFDIRMMGTDIADKAVAAASRGIFGRVEIERGLPPATLQRWFTPVDGGWKIHDEIRGLASFRTLNLMEDVSSLGRFDIVFCRNVAIYFNEPDRTAVFRRLGRTLEPDGYLVIGSTESLSGICPEYESKRHLRCVYYQHRSVAGSPTTCSAAAAPATAVPIARPSTVLPASSMSIVRPPTARPTPSVPMARPAAAAAPRLTVVPRPAATVTAAAPRPVSPLAASALMASTLAALRARARPEPTALAPKRAA